MTEKKQMKTLTLGSVTYEVVDGQVRTDISTLQSNIAKTEENLSKLEDTKTNNSHALISGSISMGRVESSLIGENSVALGSNVNAQTESSSAFGTNTVAGCLGYYIAMIEGDSSTAYITLTENLLVLEGMPIDTRNLNKEKPSSLNTMLTSPIPQVTKGDFVYIATPYTHHTFCGTVESVNDNVLVVKNLNTHYIDINTGKEYEYLLDLDDMVHLYNEPSDAIIQKYIGSNDFVVCIPNQPTWGKIPVSVACFAAGYENKVAGDFGCAFGRQNIVCGPYGHAEGLRNRVGYGAHAEGGWNKAEGQYSHTEGSYTQALEYASHSEGVSTKANARASHAEGYETLSSGYASHSEGELTSAEASCAHAEGWDTHATESHAHSEGEKTSATGRSSHAEGDSTTASSRGSHSEGEKTVASGNASHSEGIETEATAEGTHAEGYRTKATGQYSHTEGNNTKATEHASHAEGELSTAESSCAHAEGWDTHATGAHSHSEGEKTTAASRSQHVQGKWNVIDSNGKYAHIVGNGTSESARSNAHTIDWFGNGAFAGAVSSNGADYAEFFEWLDGNPNNEDRIGLVVTLDGEKIKLAQSSDDILGIISGTAAILGDNYEWEWSGKYLTDEFGRPLCEDNQRKLNPNYDSAQEYVSRSCRPEWDMVGMIGKLYVRDDGTCKPNLYATISNDGIATSSACKTSIRVLSRVTDNIIKVLLK